MDGGINMKQPVITIEEPNGRVRYASLPIYVYDGTSSEDVQKLKKDMYNLAIQEAGDGIILDIEWMREEEL